MTTIHMQMVEVIGNAGVQFHHSKLYAVLEQGTQS